MEQHPQIKAYEDAAEALKDERYWDYNSNTEKIEFLHALGEVLRDVCYQLDKYDVLPVAAMAAYREASDIKLPAAFETSAELILMSSLQSKIEQLRAN